MPACPESRVKNTKALVVGQGFFFCYRPSLPASEGVGGIWLCEIGLLDCHLAVLFFVLRLQLSSSVCLPRFENFLNQQIVTFFRPLTTLSS